MVDSKQHSRFSPEVNPKLGAKIVINCQYAILCVCFFVEKINGDYLSFCKFKKHTN